MSFRPLIAFVMILSLFGCADDIQAPELNENEPPPVQINLPEEQDTEPVSIDIQGRWHVLYVIDNEGELIDTRNFMPEQLVTFNDEQADVQVGCTPLDARYIRVGNTMEGIDAGPVITQGCMDNTLNRLTNIMQEFFFGDISIIVAPTPEPGGFGETLILHNKEEGLRMGLRR